GLVGVGEPGGDAVEHRRHLRRRQRAAAVHQVVQALALQELGDQEGYLWRALVDAIVGHRDDVGVAQLAERLGLQAEARKKRLAPRQLGEDDLERERLVEVDVDGAVDRPHAAAAEAALEAVAAVEQALAGERLPQRRLIARAAAGLVVVAG